MGFGRMGWLNAVLGRKGVDSPMTYKQVETARRMWAEGKSLKSIAHAIGMTNAAVANHMMRHREEFPYRYTKQRRLTEQDVDAMRELRGQGLTYAAIAEKFGCHKNTVYNALRRRG